MKDVARVGRIGTKGVSEGGLVLLVVVVIVLERGVSKCQYILPPMFGVLNEGPS